MSNERVVLVTGSTDGIGLQTARELARTGARVIVHGRSQAKVDAARKTLAKEGREAEGVTFDLASLASVRQGASELVRRFPRLDVLINNAGVMMNERVVTQDGFEMTFQVNHLAHFLLTRQLLDTLLRGPGARILNVSSMAHTRGQMAFDDLQLERGFSPYAAYAQSKLANVLFTQSLAERYRPEQVTANSLHPGVVGTKLLREGFGSNGFESLEEGAATSVFLATSDQVKNVTGRYFSHSRETAPAPQALDQQAREQLWEISEKLLRLA